MLHWYHLRQLYKKQVHAIWKNPATHLGNHNGGVLF
jgi:hypothetical protein